MTVSIPIGAKVICTDGPWGKSTAIIVDPASRKLTHFVVVEKSPLHGEERLVPVSLVIKTTRDEVYLSCKAEEIAHMDPFTSTHYEEIDQGADGYAYVPPYSSMYPEVATVPMPPVVQDELVPQGMVAVHRGMAVEALDGPVGQVGELLIDAQSNEITHFLLMKGRGWGKKEIAIPLSMIDHLESETIFLNVALEKINQLPSLPVKREWNEVYATDLELMVWVYEGKDLAKQALAKIQALRKQYAMEILNATVLEKDLNGKTHIHEEKKIRSKRRVALGLALGGLAGMVVGPVALVAGAVAGGAAGKRSAKKVEVGFSEEKLKKLDQSLVPGGSALVLLVEHRWFNTLQLEMAESGGQLIYERLSDISFDQLADQVQKA